MKRNKEKSSKLNKKAQRFIETNFPDYNSMTVIQELDSSATVLLDYGSREPKLKVEIEKTCDNYNLYRLKDTQFVY